MVGRTESVFDADVAVCGRIILDEGRQCVGALAQHLWALLAARQDFPSVLRQHI